MVVALGTALETGLVVDHRTLEADHRIRVLEAEHRTPPVLVADHHTLAAGHHRTLVVGHRMMAGAVVVAPDMASRHQEARTCIKRVVVSGPWWRRWQRWRTPSVCHTAQSQANIKRATNAGPVRFDSFVADASPSRSESHPRKEVLLPPNGMMNEARRAPSAIHSTLCGMTKSGKGGKRVNGEAGGHEPTLAERRHHRPAEMHHIQVADIRLFHGWAGMREGVLAMS